MQSVIKLFQSGGKVCSKDVWNCIPSDFYLEYNILMKGHQVVIPNTLKNKILQQLHIGHFGIVKMKNL